MTSDAIPRRGLQDVCIPTVPAPQRAWKPDKKGSTGGFANEKLSIWSQHKSKREKGKTFSLSKMMLFYAPGTRSCDLYSNGIGCSSGKLNLNLIEPFRAKQFVA